MWKIIAEAIAKEASYRAQREMEWRDLTIMTAGGILRYNILVILILSFISGLTGLASLEGREAAVIVAIPLFMIEIMVGTLSMALSLQTIVSDKLLEPIQHLPIEEGELRKALSLLGIYWGGLALPFAMIPAGLISSMILSDPSILAGYFAASITGMILSLALGYLVGSIGGKYQRSLFKRTISTLLWTILIGFGLFINAIMGTFSNFSEPYLSMLRLVPPLSFLDWSLHSLVSSALTFALSLTLLVYGTSRFWRAAISPGEATSVSLSWKLSFGVESILMKDLKIALRNPRMLAPLIVYSIALPLFLIGSMIEWIKLDIITTIVLSISLGTLQAVYSAYSFYLLDSTGARALYTLPMSRREVASMKTLSLLTFNSIPFILISISFIYLWGIWAFIPIYLIALTGSGYLNCLIYAKMLPKEPANWSVETFKRWIITIIMMIQTILSLPLIVISQFLPTFALWLSSLYLVAIYGASLYLSHELRDEPL